MCNYRGTEFKADILTIVIVLTWLPIKSSADGLLSFDVKIQI